MTSISYKLRMVEPDFMYDTGRSTVEQGYVDCAEGAIDVLLSWPMKGDGGRAIDQYDACTIKRIFDLYHDLRVLLHSIQQDVQASVTLADGDTVSAVDFGQAMTETFNDFESEISGALYCANDPDSGTWFVYRDTRPPDEEDWIISYRDGTYYLDSEDTANLANSSNLDALIVECILVRMDAEGFWPNLYVTHNGVDYQQVIDFKVQDPAN